MNTPSRNMRFILWVDAVGGFLVCGGNQIAMGQAAPGSSVDVAIQGDLSRRHATVSRHGEGYVLAPIQPIRLAGRKIEQPVNLVDGDEFEMGGGVRLRFRKPHVLSGSARLDVVSGHRTAPHVDGVILMAESCVLGPALANHVVCRNWSSDLVLFRRDDSLHCRSSRAMELNGKPVVGQSELPGNARLEGEDFSLSVELLT